MPMQDWRITNYTDPNNGSGTWVYYKNPNFPGIHFSRSVDDPSRDHMATDDRMYYYYGRTNSFNMNTPPDIARSLVDAWRDYFTVR